jgi:CHASE2 domain-containing sensor protein
LIGAEKLVVLKLDGNLKDTGFGVNLELGFEGERPYEERSGTLPAAPKLILYLEQWQQQYRLLDTPSRIKPKKIIYGGAIDRVDKLIQLSHQLGEELKTWLESESFRPIDKLLREELSYKDSIRVLLRAENSQLHRLPWHLWDFLESYPRAELAFGTSTFKQIKQFSKVSDRGKIRILAIIGNSEGIDTEADRQLLRSLPDTEIVFLVEPKRQELNTLLWEKPWDILFFAGHSETDKDCGRIHINAEDGLTIDELKYGLKHAIASGLQLAVFNSCDGLGLAYQLERLNLPQIVVMREAVPDRVAQEFLKNFLRAFSSGNSLYLATRIAREKLQGWENRFPCASWLPVIYQNPAITPPSWQDLTIKRNEKIEALSNIYSEGEKTNVNAKISFFQKLQKLLSRWQWNAIAGLLLVSLLVTNLITGVRSFGVLQNWELADFDRLMQMRSPEEVDPYIAIVTISNADIAYQQQKGMLMEGSLSDEALALLLEKIMSYQPKAIGLDIYKDRPFNHKLASLVARAHQLVGICQSNNLEANSLGIEGSPNLPLARLGFSDIPYDSDNAIRRQFLGMTPDALCGSDLSFSLRLALKYLQTEPVKMTPQGLQIGDLILRKLTKDAGGYQLPESETQGYQILINYRSSNPKKVSLKEILDENNGARLNQLIRDRLILIGTDLPDRDRHDTPYSNGKIALRSPGVVVHAQAIGQLISAVRERRAILNWLPEWVEIMWIGFYAVIGGTIAHTANLIYNRQQKLIYLSVAIATAILALYLCCYLLLNLGIWLPSIPAILAFIAAAIAIAYNPLDIKIIQRQKARGNRQ